MLRVCQGLSRHVKTELPSLERAEICTGLRTRRVRHLTDTVWCVPPTPEALHELKHQPSDTGRCFGPQPRPT